MSNRSSSIKLRKGWVKTKSQDYNPAKAQFLRSNYRRRNFFATCHNIKSSSSAKSREGYKAQNELHTKYPDWPSKPEKLHVFDVYNILSLMGDVLLLLLAFAFVGTCLSPSSLSDEICRIQFNVAFWHWLGL